MILKGSQRGGAKDLAQHLLKTEENEHVELHELRGFVSQDLTGALLESYAVSKGTRCQQFLFSLSLSPPETESVTIDVFEDALARIEKKMGLEGQPRAVVFHEKEGRRHGHAVWSRIDCGEMRAVNLPHFKLKLRDISRELYMEHGWKMPRGLMNSEERDPTNFTLAEWQQAKRAGHHPKTLKAMFQECWAVSDSKAAFEHALKERGFTMARGDRRGFVALDCQGEVFSVARMVGIKTKAVRARLGDPENLPSVDEAKTEVAKRMTPAVRRLMREAETERRENGAPLLKKRNQMGERHRQERGSLDEFHAARAAKEQQTRQERFSKGLRGLWDRVTGKHRRLRAQNERWAAESLARDREERQALIDRQLEERRTLQIFFRRARQRHTGTMAGLHRDIARFNSMAREPAPGTLREEFASAARAREHRHTKEPRYQYEHEPR